MKKIFLTLMIAVSMALSPALAFADDQPETSAGGGATSSEQSGSGSVFSQSIKKGLNEISGGQDKTEAGDVIKLVINTLLFIVGVVAVIMIIYAGIQYVVSAGDSGKIATAKNTILYSVIGLIVAVLAYALVNFIINTFNK